jgi:CHAT domain-containing protein/tetratricopeptide (TPR) repeat protein
MAHIPRLCRCLCFLLVILICPLFATSQTAGETELRALTEKFWRSWEKLDADTYLSVWSKTSEEGASNWARVPKSWAIYDKTELKKLEIHRVTIQGDKGTVRLTVNFAALNKQNGKPLGGFMNRDAKLSFLFVKTDGKWLLDSWVGTSSQFAEEVAQAGSDAERRALIAADRNIVDAEFVSELGAAGLDIGSRDGDYARGLEVTKLALELGEQLGDKQMISQTHSFLANIYMNLGDHGLALLSDLKHLELELDRGADGNPRNARNSVGVDYANLGDYPHAIEFYEQSLNIPTAKPPSPEGQTRVLGNIVNSAIQAEDFGKARSTLDQLFDIAQKNNIKPDIVRSFLYLGDIKRSENEPAAAKDFYLKALESQKGTRDEGRDNYVLKKLAEIEVLNGNYADALSYAQKAAQMATKIGVPDLGWDAQLSAARAYIGLKEYAKAKSALNDAIATIERMRTRNVGNEAAQQLFFSTKAAPYLELAALQAHRGETNEAFSTSETAKARVLLSILSANRTPISKSMTLPEQTRERELASKVSRLNVQLQGMSMNPRVDKGILSKLDSDLTAARLEYDNFQTKLYADHAGLLSARGGMKEITAADSTALLATPGTALVEYVNAPDETIAFVISSSSAKSPAIKHVRLEIKRAEIAKRIDEFRSKMASGDLNFSKGSNELYALLIKPIEAQLAGKTNIVIVPDGPLWDLPFQGLMDQKGKYLAEKAAISYAPSLTALNEMKKRAAARKVKRSANAELIAFGNPIVSNETSTRVKQVFMGEKLEPLPEADRLVSGLAKMYGAAKSKVYTGAAAREEVAKKESPNFRIVQFATHGILNNSSPMYSHLVLAKDEKNQNEDGLLEAWELKDLDLNADMLVLSACDTARGRISAGEGIIGMTWAAFIAGAPTTIASQWKVESSSTTELMLEFHRQLLGGKVSKAEALRRAQLKLMRDPKYRHPSYWAAWVLVGDAS